MNKFNFQLKEISVVLAAENNNPSILNADFLRFNNIVPKDWQLKEPPVCVFPFAQVVFDNGIKITSQLEKVVFLEELTDDYTGEIRVASLACRYVEQVPHVPYTGVGVNPRGHIIVDDPEKAKTFIQERFILPKTWAKFRESLVNATVNLTYKLEQSQFNISIQPATIRDTKAVVLFTGNFHHDITAIAKDDKISTLCNIVMDWQNDLRIFEEYIDNLN